MSTKRRKTNQKKNKPTITKNKVLASLIIFSLISFLSVITDKLGLLGNFLGAAGFKLFGVGAYALPLLVIVLCIVLLRESKTQTALRNTIYAFLLFFVVLLLIDLKIPMTDRLTERVQFASLLADVKSGAGIISAAVNFVLLKVFGVLGVYIFSATVILLSILSFTNADIKALAKKAIQWGETKWKNRSKPSTFYRGEKREGDMSSKATMEGETIPPITDYLSDRSVSETEARPDKEIEYEQLDIDLSGMERIYRTPPLELLKNSSVTGTEDSSELVNKAKIIEETLESFGIPSKIVQINRGPTVTCFELDPSPGIKISRIVGLSDNLALNLAASGIRIEAPIPGKPYVGIEVPNEQKDVVSFKELVSSQEFTNSTEIIPFALGKDISGATRIASIDKMPHLLIAGATGSGKSVCINTIIMSILYRCSPEKLKLLLIDPKVVELSVYNGIAHLVTPVVTNPKQAASALEWTVGEMERRYKLFSENSVRDIGGYLEKTKIEDIEHLPYIVVIIDELSDLMMASAQSVENSICRLAQMARACGIHLIIATQRPSVDVITGTIKANIPSRIAFAVSSQIDSRTILDTAGAEKLLGKGDMLFYPSSATKPIRLQGAFITEGEVENVVNYLKEQREAEYDEEMIRNIQTPVSTVDGIDEADELLDDAARIVVNEGHASVSLLQRRLKVGYARAGRIIDQLEKKGIVGGYEGSKPRTVLVGSDYFETKEE